MLSPDRPRTSAARRRSTFASPESTFAIEAPTRPRRPRGDALPRPHVRDAGRSPDIMIAVALRTSWEIHGLEARSRSSPPTAPLPQVAGAVVTSDRRDVAANRRLCQTMRASRRRKRRAGRWHSSVTTGNRRLRWRRTCTGVAGATSAATTCCSTRRRSRCFRFRSRSTSTHRPSSQFPIDYRRAVEASPWYVTPAGHFVLRGRSARRGIAANVVAFGVAARRRSSSTAR